MRNRVSFGLLAAALFLLAILIIIWKGAPRLIEFSPSDQSENVASGAVIRVKFSRPLRTSEVEERMLIEPSVSGTFRWEGSTLIFQPDQPWTAGASVSVRVEPGAHASGFPPLPLRAGAEWIFSIREARIVYLSPASGPADLFMLNPSSGMTTPITENSGGILDFDLSQDGKSLFYSERQKEDGSIIYQMEARVDEFDPDSDITEDKTRYFSQPVEILKCQKSLCQGLAVDPLVRYLAYERIGLPGGDAPEMPQVWILPLPAIDSNPPFLAGDSTHQTIQPVWSSASLLAYYDDQESAYLFAEPGQAAFSSFSNQTGQQGVWQPDGKAFLAAEIINLDENVSSELTELSSFADSHLILFDLASGQIQDLSPGTGVEDAAPGFSPDGSLLAFARKYLDVERWTPGRQFWIATFPGKLARQMSDAPVYNHFDFAWSPNGEQIAYVRFNQSVIYEPPEIWILNLLLNESARYIQDGYQPQWIP